MFQNRRTWAQVLGAQIVDKEIVDLEIQLQEEKKMTHCIELLFGPCKQYGYCLGP